jgi:tetratricopeptide (TPR) repeat protein
MTRTLLSVVSLVAISAAVPAQSPEPPITDTRLTVHTLLREDIFAGFLQGDLARMARAEKNADLLLASRPMDRPAILAWQGGIALTRAVMANDAKQADQFRQQYRRAQDLFAEAMKLAPNDVGVFAITGGSQVSIADRLPAAERKAAWELGYTAYQRLWKMQEQMIENLPLHHKGEVLSGLAQTADRTGRREEADAGVDRILTLLPDTPYASRARQWKDDPSGRCPGKSW